MNNGNEQAYPSIAEEKDWIDRKVFKSNKGLSKREIFAMAAMQGIISSMHSPETRAGEGDPRVVAKEAIEYADELLTQLEQTKP